MSKKLSYHTYHKPKLGARIRYSPACSILETHKRHEKLSDEKNILDSKVRNFLLRTACAFEQIFPVSYFTNAYFRRYLLTPINWLELRVVTIRCTKNPVFSHSWYKTLPAFLSWNTVVCLVIRSGVLWLK